MESREDEELAWQITRRHITIPETVPTGSLGVKSGRTTSGDGMRCHYIDIVLQLSRDNLNTAEKGLRAWVDHMAYDYDMFTLNSIDYIYNAST